MKLPESVSDHMYQMSLMAMTIPKNEEINNVHAMKLALVHDLAESIVGDITPYDGISKELKYKLELNGMTRICNEYFQHHEKIGMELMNLWTEYEKEQNLNLNDFFKSTENIFTSSILKQIDSKIRNQRNYRLSKSSSSSSTS